jgi:hypothetical protein
MKRKELWVGGVVLIAALAVAIPTIANAVASVRELTSSIDKIASFVERFEGLDNQVDLKEFLAEEGLALGVPAEHQRGQVIAVLNGSGAMVAASGETYYATPVPEGVRVGEHADVLLFKITPAIASTLSEATGKNLRPLTGQKVPGLRELSCVFSSRISR